MLYALCEAPSDEESLWEKRASLDRWHRYPYVNSQKEPGSLRFSGDVWILVETLLDSLSWTRWLMTSLSWGISCSCHWDPTTEATKPRHQRRQWKVSWGLIESMVLGRNCKMKWQMSFVLMTLNLLISHHVARQPFRRQPSPSHHSNRPAVHSGWSQWSRIDSCWLRRICPGKSLA